MWKLWKYDVKSVFKVWWIASLAVLGISALGGLCLRMLINMTRFESDVAGGLSDMMFMMSSLAGILFSYIALIAYALVVTFFVLRRFYCHFFTDEGYLTFTLPVKRTHLLTAKMLMALVYDILVLAVFAVCCGVFGMVGLMGMDGFVISEVMELFGEVMTVIRYLLGDFLPVYLLEAVLLLIAQSLFGALYAYLCITIGSIVAKRQKILAAIGIYYGGSVALSFLSQIAFTLLFSLNLPFLTNLSNSSQDLTLLALIGLLFLLVLVGLGVLCYCLILRLLNRRLNLA